MAKQSKDAKAVINDLAEIERLVGDLQVRLGRIGRNGARSAWDGATSTVSESAGHISDSVADALSDVADKVRDGARNMSDEAVRAGGDALRRIGDEVENRPLMTLAIAAGIGFLAGLAGRRS
jgi:ElaB/YqjD/DUF883 family membrane-anchored ribosome-binding protein